MGEEREPKMTFWLFFSITVCVFGNSFLFGYNIGVVNSPASLIKAFYSQIYLARDGTETVYNAEEQCLHYTKLSDVPSSAAPPSTTLAVIVANSSGVNYTNPSNASGSTTVAPVTRNPLLAKSKEEIEEDNFIDLMWSVTVAMFVFFGMVGAFLSGKIADHFGRKKGMILITVIMFVAAIFGGIPTVAKSPECLLISRIFVGLHNGIAISLASLYLAEISPRKIRGAVGTCHQLFITIGILWSTILGLPDISGTWGSWPVLFAFNAFPALVCLVLFPLCPESPRYLLIKKNDEDGAKKGLIKLRGYEDVEDELEEMRAEARKASSVVSFSIKQLLTTPELKLPLIIAVVMQVAQQWSGINAAMSYSRFIYSQAQVPEDTIPYVIVGQSTINVLATIVCVPLMEKLGRRPLLIYPMGGMVVSFLVLTVSLNLMTSGNYEEQKFALAMVSITVMMTYVIGFAVGLGPIPFVVVSEIFRQEPRAAAMSFSLAFNWICNFILMLSFRFIQDDVNVQLFVHVLFVFGNIPGAVNVQLFVPFPIGVIPCPGNINFQLCVLFVIGVIRRTGPTCVPAVDEIVDDSLQSLREENQRLRQRVFCLCCQIMPRCVQYIPCGHLLYCSDCDMFLQLRHCPLCNTTIRGWQDVLFS